MAENPLYISPDSLADDSSSIGGGSVLRYARNPLYSEDDVIANSYGPSKLQNIKCSQIILCIVASPNIIIQEKGYEEVDFNYKRL